MRAFVHVWSRWAFQGYLVPEQLAVLWARLKLNIGPNLVGERALCRACDQASRLGVRLHRAMGSAWRSRMSSNTLPIHESYTIGFPISSLAVNSEQYYI